MKNIKNWENFNESQSKDNDEESTIPNTECTCTGRVSWWNKIHDGEECEHCKKQIKYVKANKSKNVKINESKLTEEKESLMKDYKKIVITIKSMDSLKQEETIKNLIENFTEKHDYNRLGYVYAYKNKEAFQLRDDFETRLKELKNYLKTKVKEIKNK